MRNKLIVFSTLLVSIAMLAGCGGGEQPKTNANQNVNAQKTNQNSALTTVKTPVPATTNDAPTLTPVFKAYCDAMTKKNEAALRKIYSAETLKIFEADMKEEGSKNLIEYLSAEQVSNDLCEVRNEKIDGDVGVAEVKTKGMPNGITIKFVKENGEWKITNVVPDFEAVKNAADAQKKANPSPANAPAAK